MLQFNQMLRQLETVLNCHYEDVACNPDNTCFICDDSEIKIISLKSLLFCNKLTQTINYSVEKKSLSMKEL